MSSFNIAASVDRILYKTLSKSCSSKTLPKFELINSRIDGMFFIKLYSIDVIWVLNWCSIDISIIYRYLFSIFYDGFRYFSMDLDSFRCFRWIAIFFDGFRYFLWFSIFVGFSTTSNGQKLDRMAIIEEMQVPHLL